MALTEEQKEQRAAQRRLAIALREEDRARIRDAKHRAWREKDMFLTREQALAGEPCRGCGSPVIDELGSWPPPMRLTQNERQEHDLQDAAYRERHKNCDAHRWGVQGSRAMHCGLCCPPLPLSAEQVETISRIFASHTPRPEELDVWALSLTCGHRVERSVHHTNRQWSGSTVHCQDCAITRGVVESERVVDAANRMVELQRKRDADVVKAHRDVAKAEAAVVHAKRKLEALTSHPTGALDA
jgi:hypothetical protein